jgi:hypothetical protein
MECISCLAADKGTANVTKDEIAATELQQQS